MTVDADQLASLYAESADEDRDLAEKGIEEYEQNLLAEDTQ